MRRSIVLLLIALVAAAATGAAPLPAAVPGVLHYTVLFQGQVGGSEVVRTRADGRRHVELHYRNNGRGPDIVEDHQLAADGSYTRLRIRGTATFGKPVDEEVRVDGGRAVWRSGPLRGQRPIAGPAVYLPVDSSLTALAQSAIVARANGNRVALLPAGELRVKRLVTRTVSGAPGARDVGLYALIGLTTEPLLLWLTEGPSPRLFASVEPWMTVIEQGYEAQVEALASAIVTAQADEQRARVQRLRHPLPGLTVLRDVRVFDSDTGQVGPRSDLTIADGRITTIRPAGSQPQQAATTIEGAGRIVLPGLFDMHAHVFPEDGPLNLSVGVTTVRDLGNDNAQLAELRAATERHERIGTRIVANGFIEGEGEHSARNGIVVADLDAARRAVDWYAERGVRQLKLYTSFRPEWVAPIADYAHAQGLKVGGHVPAGMRSREALAAGYDEIHHLAQLLLDFVIRPGDDTRTGSRLSILRERLADLHLDSAPVDALIADLKARGTVVDPTVSIHEGFVHVSGEPNPGYAAVIDHLPLTLQRVLGDAMFDVTPRTLPRDRQSFARVTGFLKRLYDAGITLVPGTDAFAGFSLQRELELYVEAGIPAARVLQMATRDAARVAGLGGEAGRIVPGYVADLVLVDGDPTTRIGDIRRVAAVVQGDSLWLPAELHAELGIRPFAPPAAFSAPAAAP